MKKFKEIGVKIIATSLMVAMAMSLVACKKEADETAGQSFTAPSAQSRTFTGIANAADAKAGDIIIFGSYEQDNDLSNGAEDIEWLVLDNTDGKLLVISKSVLNYMRFSNATTVWEYSDLRTWLNGEFYDSAFSDDEKSSIVLSVVENPGNPYYDTSAGSGTNDNVFCLSYDEACTYFFFNNWNESSMSGNSESIIGSPSVWTKKEKLASAYAITEGYYNAVLFNYGFSANCIGVEGCDWWLRTSGQDGDHACIVGMYGSVNASETSSITVAKGVRPAMYIEY